MSDQALSAYAPPHNKTAPMREILAWAMYDVANSTYGTVIATAIYNAYFVNVIVGSGAAGWRHSGTLLLTEVIFVSSLVIVVTAPILGTICDATAAKKKALFISTMCCVAATALLACVGPGGVWPAMVLLSIANIAFGTGEDLVAAFLPELASSRDMGRISAIGWAAGYVGGLFSLGACFAYVSIALKHGDTPSQFVPVTLVGCAVYFALAVIPTFVVLKERAALDPEVKLHSVVIVGYQRLKTTITHARHYRDLFNFLITLFLYSCGTTTVIHLASVYAQKVMNFTASDSIAMILVVNVTAALGAWLFGCLQDRIGSVRTLFITLSIWTVAIAFACVAQSKPQLWVVANLVGIAMGSTGSVGRALVGQFSPEGRSGEFLGLWGMAVKLATAVGAITFGAITVITNNNYRLALFSTVIFFLAGICALLKVKEERGRLAALTDVEDPLLNFNGSGS